MQGGRVANYLENLDLTKVDTLGFEPRAFRMRSGCDTTTPCAQMMNPKSARLSAPCSSIGSCAASKHAASVKSLRGESQRRQFGRTGCTATILQRGWTRIARTS